MRAQEQSVSVVTPCFNGARYLRETLESALNQTRRPLEVIVVDDGSTDNSAVIAESFGPPVRVIRQKNQGESAARNVGMREARGDFLIFLDADDLFHPRAFEHLLNAATGKPGTVALMGCATFFDDVSTCHSSYQPTASAFFPRIVSKNLGHVHCWLTPLHLARKVGGFNESLLYFEDWDFWCQLGLTGASLTPVEFIGAYYRRHADAQTPNAKKPDRKLGHVAVVERMISGLRERPELLSAHGEAAFWSGWTALRSARDLDIPWSKLGGLVKQLESLIAEGPVGIRKSRLARLAQFLGLRPAFALQSIGWKSDPFSGEGENWRRLRAMRQEVSAVAGELSK